jgi:hypothetical protein
MKTRTHNAGLFLVAMLPHLSTVVAFLEYIIIFLAPVIIVLLSAFFAKSLIEGFFAFCFFKREFFLSRGNGASYFTISDGISHLYFLSSFFDFLFLTSKICFK